MAIRLCEGKPVRAVDESSKHFRVVGAADARWTQGMPLLMDLRTATPTLSSEGVRDVITTVAPDLAHRVPYRVAVVASTDLTYGLSRVAETYGELAALPSDFRVFRTLAEALGWLAVAPTAREAR